jgi:O-antigen ligase
MNNLFIIQDNQVNKISYWLLACFLMALPFDLFYSQLILAAFALHTLIHVQLKSINNIFCRQVLVISAFYFIALFSILYSADKQKGLQIAIKQLSILLMPVLFCCNDLDFKKYREPLLKIFSFTCTVSILFLFFDALHQIVLQHLPVSSLFSLDFMNHGFSAPIGIHATYLSMYVAFSICISLYFLLSGTDRAKKNIHIFCLVILFTGMLQLSSRAVFIALLFIINLAMPVILFSGKKAIRLFIIMTLVSISSLFIIYHVDSFKLRYVTGLKTDLTLKTMDIENTEPRMERWKAILELVQQSPVIGYGIGSEHHLLQQKYYEKNLYNSYLFEFNTHSQYLAILIQSGIFGWLVYLAALFYGIRTAWKKKDFLFMAFLGLIILVSVSENLLDLNKGIFFYSFFFSLFLINNNGAADAG